MTKTNQSYDCTSNLNTKELDFLLKKTVLDNKSVKNYNNLAYHLEQNKQYETSLRDDKGVPKHNEVTEYFDNNGDFHISILEQICKSRQEDTEEHFNEWGEKINGKKYGYIDVQTILKDYYYRTEEEIESNKEYRLNLLPEKYLRPKEFENLTLEKLIKKREELSEDIKDLINEV